MRAFALVVSGQNRAGQQAAISFPARTCPGIFKAAYREGEDLRISQEGWEY